MTTDEHTNTCRPEYRNLSPREECRLRSLILQTNERPGRLPGCMSMGGGPRQSHADLVRRVHNLVLCAPATRNDINLEVGFNSRVTDAIDDLVAAGVIVETNCGRKRTYTVAA